MPQTDYPEYATPYGLWSISQSPNGQVVGRYKLISGQLEDRFARGLENFQTGWKLAAGDPVESSSQSEKPGKTDLEWALPPTSSWHALNAHLKTLHAKHVKLLILRIGQTLQRFHQSGFGAFDIHPALIFMTAKLSQVVVLPTPSLGVQAFGHPPNVEAMPFAAPEVGSVAPEKLDLARADTYSLGALAWYLLTGKERKQCPGELPSQIDPKFRVWDAFIDGCCKSNPERRFESIAVALQSLANRPSGFVGRPTIVNANSAPAGRALQDTANHAGMPIARRRVVRILGVIAMVLVISIVVAIKGHLLPDWANPFPDHERGFADTILRYKDRSYEGAEWKQLKETAALSTLAAAGETSVGSLEGITGWDDNNFWVVGKGSAGITIIQYRDGHWRIQAQSTDWYGSTRPRAFKKDTLFLTGWNESILRKDATALLEVTEAGILNRGEFWLDKSRFEMRPTEIVPVAADLLFVASPNTYQGVTNKSLAKYSGRQVGEVNNRERDAFVHDRDGTPLKHYQVRNIVTARSPAEGTVLAFVWPIEVFENTGMEKKQAKFVRFENGFWYDEGVEIADFWPNDMWVGPLRNGKPDFAVLIGSKRPFPDGSPAVLTQEFPATQTQLTLSPSPDLKVGRLINVWGNNRSKFWVMDEHGTIWVRTGTEMRVVVRGLDRNDVKFLAAWVAPNGAVVAITDKHIYRLD